MSELRARPLSALVADTISFSSVDGPGNRFVVFLQGCNFDCVACHNPQTIPGHGSIEGHHPEHRTVDDLVAEIRTAAPFISGVTASGGEATQQAIFLHELFAAIKADDGLGGLTCMVDSNGACDLSVWDDLAPVMDGAMIDLKCLDPAIHREMTGEPNDQVLASIEHLRALWSGEIVDWRGEFDLVDRARNQLVWEGAATARVTDQMRQNRDQVLDSAIADIFAQFP